MYLTDSYLLDLGDICTLGTVQVLDALLLAVAGSHALHLRLPSHHALLDQPRMAQDGLLHPALDGPLLTPMAECATTNPAGRLVRCNEPSPCREGSSQAKLEHLRRSGLIGFHRTQAERCYPCICGRIPFPLSLTRQNQS